MKGCQPVTRNGAPIAAFAALGAAGTVLAGCVAGNDAASLRPSQRCDAVAAQRFIGAMASTASGVELMRLTGARSLRWVPPRTIVTAEFRPGRLTVDYDDTMAITRIACG
ncbi:I78 family peptidase inhibitor [Novosphingobium album (ex Hu et al. 2023)]|nr:I78 family peptidase inhibitor [Novosphingobium album (ex Hu et al. 2023)]